MQGVWKLGVSGGSTVKYSLNYSMWDGGVQRGGDTQLGARGREGGTNSKRVERKRMRSAERRRGGDIGGGKREERMEVEKKNILLP